MYIALSALYMCTSVTIVCTCKKYSITTFNLLPTGLLVVIPGWETEEEEFAGGDYTTTYN